MANTTVKSTTNLTEDYVDKAERLMQSLSRTITTSKIRDLLSQVNELYNDIILDPTETLDENYVEAVRHLRVKMIYDAGRDPGVKSFFNQTGLLDMVKTIGNSRKRFLDYCKYFEALVAYHKFYDGGR